MIAPVAASRTDAAPLCADALALLRALLLCEVVSQTAQAFERRAQVKALTGHTDGDSQLEREAAEGCAARADHALEGVHRALERLADGTYGFCGHCGRPIPFERLEALPHARHCVECVPCGEGRRRS